MCCYYFFDGCRLTEKKNKKVGVPVEPDGSVLAANCSTRIILAGNLSLRVFFFSSSSLVEHLFVCVCVVNRLL